MTPTLAATLAATVLAAGYLLACWIWPFAACLTCSGDGKRRSPSGKAWRTCKRCGGSGARLRIGRRVWNYLQGTREASR